MSITISSDMSIDTGMFPLPVKIELICEMMFCRAFEAFTDADGYIGAHRAAMTKGWLERQSPEGRLWICPHCSKKTVI